MIDLLVCSYQMGSDTLTSLVTCIKLPGVRVHTLRRVNVLAVEGLVWQYYFIKFTHMLN